MPAPNNARQNARECWYGKQGLEVAHSPMHVCTCTHTHAHVYTHTHLLNMLNMIPMKLVICNFLICIFSITHGCTCMYVTPTHTNMHPTPCRPGGPKSVSTSGQLALNSPANSLAVIHSKIQNRLSRAP